jgi:hypothetical protein
LRRSQGERRSLRRWFALEARTLGCVVCLRGLASVDDLVQFGTANIRAVQSIEDKIVEGALAKELGCVNGDAVASYL